MRLRDDEEEDFEALEDVWAQVEEEEAVDSEEEEAAEPSVEESGGNIRRMRKWASKTTGVRGLFSGKGKNK